MGQADRAGFFYSISGSNRKYLELNHTHTRKYSINTWSSMPGEIAKQVESGFSSASRVGDDKWLSKMLLFFIKNFTLLSDSIYYIPASN